MRTRAVGRCRGTKLRPRRPTTGSGLKVAQVTSMFGQGGPQIIVRGKGLCNSEKDFVLAKPRALVHEWHNALGKGLTEPEGGPGRPSRLRRAASPPCILGPGIRRRPWDFWFNCLPALTGRGRAPKFGELSGIHGQTSVCKTKQFGALVRRGQATGPRRGPMAGARGRHGGPRAPRCGRAGRGRDASPTAAARFTETAKRRCRRRGDPHDAEPSSFAAAAARTGAWRRSRGGT